MLKKIFICILLVTIMTACNNEEDKISSLCNKIENDIKSYQNNEIEKTELYTKLENYQSVCMNSTTDICITINAIISIPKEKEEVRDLFIKDILNHCNKK